MNTKPPTRNQKRETRNRLHKTLWVFAIVLTLSACDTSAPEVDDGKVAVRYAISAENGAMVDVFYLGEDGEAGGGYVGDGWEYEFRAEEGSQLLYMATKVVNKGSVEAQIYIDGELHQRHVHVAPNSTADILLASSAWGLNENIPLYYSIQGIRLERAEVSLLDGIDTFDELDTNSGSFQSLDRQLSVDANFEAVLRVSRGSIEDGFRCVRAYIYYFPEGGEELYVLAYVVQCDVAPIEIDLSMPVPGY